MWGTTIEDWIFQWNEVGSQDEWDGWNDARDGINWLCEDFGTYR